MEKKKLTKKDEFSMVLEFHRTFEYYIPPSLHLVSPSIIDARAKMIRGECDEFATADTEHKFRDLTVDMFYFLYGAFAEIGASPAIVSWDEKGTFTLPSHEQRIAWGAAIVGSTAEMREIHEVPQYVALLEELAAYLKKIAIAAGISYKVFKKDFATVHKSNMTKFWTEKEVNTRDIIGRLTPEYTSDGKCRWYDDRGHWVDAVGSTSRYRVTKDGKVIKPPSWKEPIFE